jgi:hypothetical protein
MIAVGSVAPMLELRSYIQEVKHALLPCYSEDTTIELQHRTISGDLDFLNKLLEVVSKEQSDELHYLALTHLELILQRMSVLIASYSDVGLIGITTSLTERSVACEANTLIELGIGNRVGTITA